MKNQSGKQESKKVVLTSAYFGSIQYFSKIIDNNEVYIEQYDSYSKQTYRNRCSILGSGGPLALSIPVKRKRNEKTLVKDILIDYDMNWQKLHWRSLISCYNSSPFFEYLSDEIEPFFSKKYKFLIDLNNDLLLRILQILGLNIVPEFTREFSDYKKNPEVLDTRELISPKVNFSTDKSFNPTSYHQVFNDKLGFVPNLSILDLLFNCGQEAPMLLKNSIRKIS